MLVEFVTQCLDGVDLDRFPFLVPTICGFILVVSVALAFRAILALFDIFFK